MTEAVARHRSQMAGLAGGSRKSFCKWRWGRIGGMLVKKEQMQGWEWLDCSG